MRCQRQSLSNRCGNFKRWVMNIWNSYIQILVTQTLSCSKVECHLLAKFYQLVTDLVRESWAHYIRRFNHSLLGTTTDLHEFLFGTDQVSLSDYVPILWDLQKGSCFYCGKILRPGSTDVDHLFLGLYTLSTWDITLCLRTNACQQ